MAQAAPHREPAPVAPSKKTNDDEKLLMPLAEPAPGTKPHPTIGVMGKEIDDGERDPDTIAEEQRRRSDEYMANLEKNAKDEQHSGKNLPPPQHTSKR